MRPKKPVRNTREYIDRKNETAIFAPPLLCAALTKQDDILLWTCLPTSVLHIQNFSEIASSVPEICDFKNWLSFFIFSSSLCTLTKTAIKRG